VRWRRYWRRILGVGRAVRVVEGVGRGKKRVDVIELRFI